MSELVLGAKRRWRVKKKERAFAEGPTFSEEVELTVDRPMTRIETVDVIQRGKP
jgi:hypothetical protein